MHAYYCIDIQKNKREIEKETNSRLKKGNKGKINCFCEEQIIRDISMGKKEAKSPPHTIYTNTFEI